MSKRVNSLGNYGFGKHQYSVLKYFNYATVNGKGLLPRGRLYNNLTFIQRAHQGCVVIQNLKLTFAARKRNRRSFAGEDFTVGSNDI